MCILHGHDRCELSSHNNLLQPFSESRNVPLQTLQDGDEAIRLANYVIDVLLAASLSRLVPTPYRIRALLSKGVSTSFEASPHDDQYRLDVEYRLVVKPRQPVACSEVMVES